MFIAAYLQQQGNGRLNKEEELLRSEFVRRGVPVRLFMPKHVARRQLPLSKHTFVAGDIDAMHGAMRVLKIEVPRLNEYPECLRSYLHRKIWRTTLGSIESAFLGGRELTVFVKPAERRKSFVGRVFETIDDFRTLGGISRRQEIWCAEPVDWLSEYRVYVIGSQVVSVDRYDGDSSVEPDMSVIGAAIQTFHASGETLAAYALDFGVLSTGETALVEASDAYSLGAYQINAAAYTDVLLSRWQELVATAP